jgi:hypothetical protein
MEAALVKTFASETTVAKTTAAAKSETTTGVHAPEGVSAGEMSHATTASAKPAACTTALGRHGNE